MSKSIRTVAAMLFVATLLFLFPTSAEGADATQAPPSTSLSPSTLSAQAAVLIEADSGTVVVEKQGSLPLPMASTTKIVTGIVALELASYDTLITVSPDAVGVEGSSIYLSAGEKLTLEQLLYALLLESANDAALAIAIGLCGSVDAFAQKMNEKAAQLGLKSSHFTNPHGLDDTEHYTTAQDLAQITRYALQNELFAKIVSTRKLTIPHTDGTNVRVLINHNKLLRLYDGCIGVKTGYTKKSGRCLVSAAERDGVMLIAVTLNAPDDWNDHARMLDHGFSKFSSVTLCQKDEILLPLSVVGGTESYVMVGTAESLSRTLPTEHGTVTQRIELGRFAYAPVKKDEAVGTVRFDCDTNGDGITEEIASLPLYTRYGVERYIPKKTIFGRLKELLLHWFGKADE